MTKIFRFLKKKITLLFTVHVVTLVVWAVISALQYKLSPKADSFKFDYIIKAVLFKTIAIFIVTSILFKVYNQFQNRKKSMLFWSLVFIPLIFVGGLLADIIENSLINLFNVYETKTFSKYILYSSATLSIPLFLFSGLYFAVRYWGNAQTERENALKLEALAHEAQLQMLRYQINPHFLFNSLNTIRATISLDQEKARHTVTLLSDFFRYTLEKDTNNLNTIGMEIEAIKNYLNIQKIRYEEKLEFNFSIDPLTQDIEIPFFIIHPLVENAVKYGTATCNPPLQVHIKSAIVNKDLMIEVVNSGSLISESENIIDGTNTGIENIRKRLDLVYPNKYKLSLTEEDSKVKARLIIQNIVH